MLSVKIMIFVKENEIFTVVEKFFGECFFPSSTYKSLYSVKDLNKFLVEFSGIYFGRNYECSFKLCK